MAEKMIVDDGAMVMEPKGKVTDKMEINCQMEELKKQLLASQQKVEELTKENGTNQLKMQELTKENGNLQQKVEELAKENEQQKQDFEGRIAQLQQENEEIHKELGKKLTEEEDQQIMRPMHEMKVQLPLENWFDLLALVPRLQLGNIVSEIGDRQFARILQSFLHEHGDITLDRMKIIPPRPNSPSDRTLMRVWHYRKTALTLDLPDWPMPENVKSFDEIILEYDDVDMHVLDFLRKFQENNILANVNLDIGYGERDQMLPVLDKILPLISSIYSINFDMFDNVYNNYKQSQLLLKTMVAQTKILAIRWYTPNSNCTWKYKIDWYCSWLYNPRDDGMSRTLVLGSTLKKTHYSSLIDRIKKDFEEANHAVTFFISLILYENFQQEMSLKNNKTNEKLLVKAEVSCKTRVLISRHSLKAAKRKIEEEEKEIFHWRRYSRHKQIRLYFGREDE